MATTFTIGGGNVARPYYLGGMRLQVRSFPEGASQTFVPGDLLTLQSTGSHKANEVIIASNDPTAGANIVGFAVHGATGSEFTGWAGTGGAGAGSRTDSTALASGAASSLGPGIAGSLGQGMSASYVNSGGTAVLSGSIGVTKGLIQVQLALESTLWVAHVLSGQAISADKIGVQVGFERDASNLIWRVDAADTGNTSVTIVDLFDSDGDVNGRYIFKFVAANLLYRV